MTGSEIIAVATITVKPGLEDEFASRFGELAVLTRALEVGGMYEARLLRPTSGSTFVVVSTWASEEAYAAWGSSSANEEVGAVLMPLLDEEPLTATFTIAEVVESDS